MTKKILRIGLTSAGGDMVPSAIIALKRNKQINFQIYAFDTTANKFGANLADNLIVTLPGNHPDYTDEMLRFAIEYQLDVLMPWSDEEALSLSKSSSMFRNSGCKILVSPPEVLKILTNKAETYKKLNSAGINVPYHDIVEDGYGLQAALKKYDYPNRTIVIKPSSGRGGRGVRILLGCDSPPEWIGRGKREERILDFKLNHFSFEKDTTYLVMPRLHDPVFDVDAFRYKNAEFKCYIRERINPTGIPFEGNFLRAKHQITEYAHAIAETLNLQSLHDMDMMTDPLRGPVLLEVNPRPSGSVSALNAAGFDLLAYAFACAAGLDYVIEEPTEDRKILTYKESIITS